MVGMYTVLEYNTPEGSNPYQEFLRTVRRSGDPQIVRGLQRATDKLSANGLALLNTAMMDNIESDIYELRVGPYRVFCFYDRPAETFMLLHGFRKRTQRTPESQKARARALTSQYLESRGRQ